MVGKFIYPATEVKSMLDQGKAMREQAVLREEMQYHYRLGNTQVLDFFTLDGYLEQNVSKYCKQNVLC